MTDRTGTPLTVGDQVTIERADPPFRNGGHGEIEKFGTKNAYVRVIVGRFESHDGDLVPLRPETLRRGWHGRPRNSDRLTDAVTDLVGAVLTQAVDAKIITADQRDRILEMQRTSPA